MKILHLSNLYHPVIGGLERSIATSSAELVRRGHEVTVLTLATPATRQDQEMIDGVRVRRVRSVATTLLPGMNADAAKPFHPTVADPFTTTAIARVLRAEHFDVVHSHDWMMYSYLPLRRTRIGRPHVHTAHDFGLTCVRKTFARAGRQCSGPGPIRCVNCAGAQYGGPRSLALTAGLHAHRHRGIDVLTAISTSVAAALGQARLPGDLPVRVVSSLVPDGLDALADRTPRPDWLPAGDYLLFVGALGPHKGIGVLFDAYRRLCSSWSGPLPALVCLGTPRPDTPPAPPGTLIRHDVPHAQVMAAFRGAAAGVVPSLNEGMGQVAVEAMLGGAPLVASAAGGLTDVVEDGVSGLLVPPGDPDALHAALRRVLTEPGLADRLRAAGRQRGLDFTAARVVPQIEEVYRACVASS
ncbi:glycosyl transferase [Actinoplanes sp. SE50]|uniref:glycosyltransferase family 4 protein n=1 Tax=unclassified Actinoplanes TaxID=2626549 RepID=UPI00023ECF6A|nr:MULTISPECIES: glycosyltransferase family 4 protein [unclassified Actinoplanes]AEV87786.1 Glycogen synthase [Actinoplanes sp. SE50/110]ATO86188.1 glycosyl transferase [Actinoplanes sp. SE50]SLM03602.1 glycosyl transferase [Actinoplanes sp. SE50/110]